MGKDGRGGGFAKCDVTKAKDLEFRDRLKYYDEVLKDDPFLDSHFYSIMNRPKNYTLKSKEDAKGDMQINRMWEVALRMRWPQNFKMDDSTFTNGKPEFENTLTNFVLFGNPMSKLALAVLDMAFSIIDDVTA